MTDEEEPTRGPNGQFLPGGPGGPGRPKGSRNFSIKSALDRAIEESFREDGQSILDALARRAKPIVKDKLK